MRNHNSQRVIFSKRRMQGGCKTGHCRDATCAVSSACCVPPRLRSDGVNFRPRHALHQSNASLPAIRDYLLQVYPISRFDSAPAEQVLSFFVSRHWYYNLSIGRTTALRPVWAALPLVRPPRFVCQDGFFGSGLMHLDMATRFPQLLPCAPGKGCVLRQVAVPADCC